MTTLTLFSAPKPFTNPHIATIQRNAIQSWKQLPDCDMLLIGSEPGIAEAAAEFGVRHLPQVECNAHGTPLLSSIFGLARQHSAAPLLCYVNADIILFSDIVEAAQNAAKQAARFLMVGQRWDVDITDPLGLDADWEPALRARVAAHGHLHPPMGSDYFIFPRACYADMPAFAVGRAGWDNWMIYKARAEGWPAIDATHDVTIVHQNHDYSHLPGGQPHYKLPETDENIRLAGGRAQTRFTLLDTDKRLVNGSLAPQRMDSERLWRRVEAWPLLALRSARLSEFVRRLRQKFRSPSA